MERSTNQVISQLITHLKHCYQGDRCTSHHYWIPGINDSVLHSNSVAMKALTRWTIHYFRHNFTTPCVLPRWSYSELWNLKENRWRRVVGAHLCSLLMNLEISGWLVRIGTSMVDCTWSLPRRVSSVSLHTQLFLGQCQHSCNSPLHNLQRVTERWMMPLIAFTWLQWRKRKLNFYLVPETWVYNVGLHPSARMDNPNVANVNQNIYRRW